MKQNDARDPDAEMEDGLSQRLSFYTDTIRKLSALLGETGLAEIEIEENGRRIRVARHDGAVGAPVMSMPVTEVPKVGATDAPARKQDSKGAVASPMVGTVYVAPEPGKAPFVQVGDAVREGDTLLIVEAMKTMNPIVAPHAGIVKEICVADAEPVEFGQMLMIISAVGA